MKAPITVAQGATVEISSAYAGAVRFAADTGTLELAQSSRFSGTVAGMSGNDSIDLADIDPTKVQPPSYSGDAFGGTLHVTDDIANASFMRRDHAWMELENRHSCAEAGADFTNQ